MIHVSFLNGLLMVFMFDENVKSELGGKTRIIVQRSRLQVFIDDTFGVENVRKDW